MLLQQKVRGRQQRRQRSMNPFSPPANLFRQAPRSFHQPVVRNPLVRPLNTKQTIPDSSRRPFRPPLPLPLTPSFRRRERDETTKQRPEHSPATTSFSRVHRYRNFFKPATITRRRQRRAQPTNGKPQRTSSSYRAHTIVRNVFFLIRPPLPLSGPSHASGHTCTHREEAGKAEKG